VQAASEQHCKRDVWCHRFAICTASGVNTWTNTNIPQENPLQLQSERPLQDGVNMEHLNDLHKVILIREIKQSIEERLAV